ncbi:M20/M25/M40 family metallo-hydrolase [Sphingomonas sediminicola]|uniref:M20/M25/M40 family metallo-hydrolase n=1 Tax=Sphingomonas sediminicola TaxID=386874 RepID=A0ABX6T568_9SPHN|nr:M20/M25/M40 family metallo-hydrolase [Sphingomonas sediminicola]QNP44989.1 M20/M25/M40 family metallo-hydrolase [Sphingomonas sediminicola]
MRRLGLLPCLALIAAAPASPDAKLKEIIAPVSGAQMKRTVEKLVSFGTRHTLSSQTDPKRGIGAALDWTQGQFKSFGLPTERPCDTFTGTRIPTPTRICDMIAVQRGTERPNDVVIITGHIDSRVTDPMNAKDDAPGANDDGSGTAAVIEAARVLSKHKFPGTIVYAALSGEEQGLYGGKVLAAYSKAQGWNVVANLNNDIIGNSCGSDGVCNDKVVRVFSEGPRWQGHEQLAKDLRSLGGENDAPPRNISRYLDSLADRLNIGLDVMQVWRNDRFGRGGDHTEFLNAGYPAVRLSVAVENYNWQHQDLRTENGIKYGDTIENMDFPYLEKIAKLNVAALAALANAPPPPEPKVEGAVSTDTSISFQPVPAAYFMIRWRRTDSNQWEHSQKHVGPETIVTHCRPTPECQAAFEKQEQRVALPHVRVDDWVFGVSSVSKDGFESPVASAVPGGAFRPYVALPPEPVK